MVVAMPSVAPVVGSVALPTASIRLVGPGIVIPVSMRRETVPRMVGLRTGRGSRLRVVMPRVLVIRLAMVHFSMALSCNCVSTSIRCEIRPCRAPQVSGLGSRHAEMVRYVPILLVRISMAREIGRYVCLSFLIRLAYQRRMPATSARHKPRHLGSVVIVLPAETVVDFTFFNRCQPRVHPH